MPSNYPYENEVDSQENDERREGVIEEQGQPLDIALKDEEITSILKNRAGSMEKWWNAELKLDFVRKRAERYYNNKPYDSDALHDHQVDYRNNRILTSIETLVPMATAQPAQAVVTEARDNDESRQLAMDLANVLNALYEPRYLSLKKKLNMIARHLIGGKRCAIFKYRFDPNGGRLKPDGTRAGEIKVDVVRPERIVFAEESSDPDNISLIIEYLTATVEELTLDFPDKKEEIFKELGIKRGVNSQLQKIVGYTENWFTYYDSDGQPQEGVAWKLREVLLDAIKNPNWNYDEYETGDDGKFVSLNFLERPAKPYIIFNHLNTGKWIIDQTSLVDQAIPLQDILNKRGRQIVENADDAEGGLVLDEDKIGQEDAAKLTGDHKEIIMVAGDTRSAASRIAPALLPSYVMDDKRDARAEIDNIFGTNAPLRGEQSGAKTLGQEIISQRANLGRLQSTSDSVEEGMSKLYAGITQLIKVYWDEDEFVQFQASLGKTSFIKWNRDKVEDGVQVGVKAGSAMPTDKFSIKNETIQMIGILDPLSIGEGLDKPDPKDFAKRISFWRFEYEKYKAEYLDGGGDDGGGDANAIADLQALMAGETPEVPDNPSKEYLSTLQQFLEGGGLSSVEDPQIKQNIIEFVQAVNDKAKSGIGEQEEAPEEEEGAGAEPGEELPPAPEPEPEGVVGNFLEKGVQLEREKLRI